MTTPTQAEGRLYAAGAKKGSAWGTAVALGANCGTLLETDGGLARKQPYLPAKETDTPFVKDGQLGNIDPVDFTPAFFARYDPGAIGLLIALLFGTAGAPTLLDTLAYQHVFQWANSTSGLFATFAIERPSKIFEVASCKPISLELSIADSKLKGAIALHGNTMIDNSSVNQAAQMDAITYDDIHHRIEFAEISAKMNDESGGDVSGETALEIKDVSVSYSRPLDAEHKGGSKEMIEPLQNDAEVIQVKFEFPRSNTINQAFFQKFTAETTQKILIKFTGDLIESTYYYDLALFFPKMRVIEIDYPYGPIIPASMTLQAEEADSNPTGMDYKRPYVELVNKKSTDYLA